MKILQRVDENFLRQQVHIDDMQFGFTRSYLDAAPQTPYLLYANYTKSSLPSTRHCTWPFSIWKRHSIVYQDVSSGGVFASSPLRSDLCSSYRAYMNARIRVRVGCNLSEAFRVKVGVSQGPRHKLHFQWWLFQLGPQGMQ